MKRYRPSPTEEENADGFSEKQDLTQTVEAVNVGRCNEVGHVIESDSHHAGGVPTRRVLYDSSGTKEFPVCLCEPVTFERTERSNLQRFMQQYGFVVIRNVSTKKIRDALVMRMDHVADTIPATLSRGFLELHHSSEQEMLRQDPRLVQAFATLWGEQREDLWVVFDRLIYHSTDRKADEMLHLTPHVDQNPVSHPDFFALQGMIALRDMNEATGTLALVPASKDFFETYKKWVVPGKTGQYVEWQQQSNAEQENLPCFAALCVKEGDLIIWDSRTTHSRYRDYTLASERWKHRYAALVSFLPRRPEDGRAIMARNAAFQAGIGTNDQDAGMRATAAPRFSASLRSEYEIPGQCLTPLGQIIYGLSEPKSSLSKSRFLNNLKIQKNKT